MIVRQYRASKSYKCHFCPRPIAQGSTYDYVVSLPETVRWTEGDGTYDEMEFGFETFRAHDSRGTCSEFAPY
jgi:hypothetical protein